MTPGFTIEALSSSHDRKGFVSGSEPLDQYLAERATQDVKRRISNCFVLLDAEGAVAGFYTLAAMSVPVGDLPPEETRKLPRYPLLPAALIGRLAIGQRYQGQGFGGALVLDAVQRSSRSDPAIFALLVEAKDDPAASFYGKLGFKAFADRPLTLYLPIATALRAFEGKGSARS